jgi:hypothetical protein
MKTFPDLDKSYLIGIDGLIGAFSPKLTSHKGSWPVLLKSQLNYIDYNNVKVLTNKDKWEDFDVIVVDWGMEFKGIFNVFGGASDDLALRLIQLLNFKGKLVSAHIPCPSISLFVANRLKTGTELFKTLVPAGFVAKEAEFLWFDQIFENNRLVFGDSHSLSAYRPGYMISRNDGLTLHGALKKGLRYYVNDSIKDLVIYLGNIDNRFHLFRQDDPVTSLETLLSNLEDQLIKLNCDNITLIGWLPAEHEERKLPGTGLYLGKPFFGSREDRNALARYANEKFSEMANRNKYWKFEGWPSDWYEMDPEQYAKTCMESKQSVHLNRANYLYKW